MEIIGFIKAYKNKGERALKTEFVLQRNMIRHNRTETSFDN